MAAQGAQVTAVDLSARLLVHARRLEHDVPVGIDYVQGDVTTTHWWDGRTFDGVVCEMALMDIDDLDGVLATATAVLSDGGWFAFSIVHPCHPGGPGTASGLPSWPPDGGYDREGWWTNEGDIGIRARVGANHRKLSTYLNAILRAGLVFEEFREPEFVVPRFLAARCRRPSPPSRRHLTA
jgi:2-polyprenyl-3-methyl-5-hydroxy-6-metoxy-1,4-benzoquinol methylase